MWKCVLVTLSVGVFVVDSAVLPLPPYLKACPRNSSDLDACALKVAQNGLPYIFKGDSKYGIPSFNPISFDEIALETPGNLKIKLKDVAIWGMDKLQVTKMKLDPDAHYVQINLLLGECTILSKYEMDGKILVLSLKGEGDANITAAGLDIKYVMTYKTEERNGDEFLVLDTQHCDLNTDKVHFHFGNLFNGDEVLGKNTNKLINDEWKSVYEELKPAIEETITSVAKSIVNGIFEKVPFKYVFL